MRQEAVVGIALRILHGAREGGDGEEGEREER
jgi:hypothetical protein